ncbi:hypothetical protein F4818DRAFT_227964 [Hypoxylon cercidicola]|nr:hypothetical protein F4818DRAFT_227964 [Hypoxylon cercidicola]
MNEGSYNNVIRSGSPFSPMTPSTPNTYKANVNRTKTRKWVEAKVQNYDGDDWGNDYEDDYGEPEQEPPSTSRVAALRQNSHSQPRTFSQPSAVDPSTAPDPSTMRSPSSPPSLHIQTGVNPRARPVEPASSVQGLGSASSRFPPGKSSVSQETSDNDVGAPISGPRSESSSSGRLPTSQRAVSPAESRSRTANAPHIIRPADIYRRVGEERERERRSIESGRPSADSLYGRSDGAASPSNAARSSIEQQRRTSFESHDGSDTSRNPMKTLAPVEERKSEYGIEQSLLSSLQDQRRLSTSPMLPDLARVSGFGDDFFPTPGGSGPSLSPVHDNREPDVVGAKLGLSDRPDDVRRQTVGPSEGKHPPSALEGPKLEPNPDIIMPPLDGDLDTKDKYTTDASHQSTLPRPQLPGTWVSETVSTGSDLTPTGKVEGLGPASLGSSANPDSSPMSGKHAEPADIEPTTTVKHLPSIHDNSEATAVIKDVHESGLNSFNSPTGKHDSTVASKVIATGPGYHPTPQSLPPLKTENPLVPFDIASNNKQAVHRPNDMAPPPSGYKNSPSRSSLAQPGGVSTALSFPPTAPLNPRRSIAAPEELLTPVMQERKSTMSTVDTASPEKESDKLREEIIKSLSASPTITPDASAILDSARGVPEPIPGSLTRESTYLSGVYDDYLAPAEEKSLQETGQLLKQESMMASSRSGDTEKTPAAILQQGNSLPDIAPLSPRRSPEQHNARLPKRFSWENAPEKVTPSPPATMPSTSEPTHGSNSISKGEDSIPALTELNAAAASPSGLQVQAEEPGIMSHQISQVSSRAPGDSTGLESPSPISLAAENTEGQVAAPDTSRSSFAEEKEKVLIQSSPNTPPDQQHPALAKPFVQPAPQGKIMAFRDILNIASIEQRIDRFDETRAQFYSMDSGLSNWIAYMQSQLEHGSASMSGEQTGPASPSGAQPATQQPYYQQYLNASNPSAPPGQPGRTSTGNLQQIFTGQPMSSFGSGNQVGAKSKELLQAAGAFGNKGVKSGMKLFTKGKNKLRGTGDKTGCSRTAAHWSVFFNGHMKRP